MKILKIKKQLKKESKDDGAIEKELLKVAKDSEKKEEVKQVETPVVDEQPVKVEEQKVEEKVAEETPATEAEPKKDDEPKVETEVETPVAEVKEEAPATEVEAEKVDDVAEPKKEENVVKVDASEIEAVLKKFTKKLKTYSKRISHAVESLNKSAPAEAVAVEETPKVEIDKVETPKEEDKVEKTDTSSGVANETILKVLDEIKSRLQALEDSPAQSTVVVSKEFVGGTPSSREDRLTKINSRLTELEEMRKSSPTKYQNEGFLDEAYSLVKEKRALGF